MNEILSLKSQTYNDSILKGILALRWEIKCYFNFEKKRFRSRRERGLNFARSRIDF